MERQVKCPHCGGPSLYSAQNPYRPFCCERCKLIDLGEWASGRYAIPADETNSSAGANVDDNQPTEKISDGDQDHE